MQPRMHLLVTCSVLLMAALLAACAAPAAAPTAIPAPPTDTPIPPAAVSDPTTTVQAWADAIYSGDVDAALDLFTDDGKYLIYYTASGKKSMRWVFNWLAGLETKWDIVDCQPQDGAIACNLTVLDGCMAASGSAGLPVKAVFILQDGKIKEATGEGSGPEWDAYWNFVSTVQAWERAYRPEEMVKIVEGTQEGGAIAIKLCREYETIVKTQAPATAAAAQGLVDALNSGDADAAMALLTDDARFRLLNGEAAGTDQLRALFDWLAGEKTQYQITNCEWRGINTQCAMTVVDGCIAAFGASDGLPGKMTFRSLEDGTLQSVSGNLAGAERKGYEEWIEAERAWASANRADELAQAEGYSKPAGAMAVKLCQAYAAAPKLDATTTAEIDALVEEIVASNQVPGLALGVVKDGELVYAKGFGVTSLEGGEPVTPQTVFQWNETSMVPTAMAVLQLVDAGKIDLDAPVTDYLPDFQMKDERYRDITVGQLLAHRSGIADSSALRANSGNTMADWENLTPEFDDAAIDRWVRSLADQELLFAPGSSFEYSDQGYALLGAVIGAASGQSYEATMEENILGPLGMDDSTFLLEEVDKAMLAAPHVTQKGNLVVSTAMPYHRPFAAANNLYASIEDMAKLAQVSLNRGTLDDQRILPEDAVDQMWEANGQTPFADFPFGTVHPSMMMIDWGYGWFLGDVAGHPVVSTVGGDYGYNGSVAVAPDANLAVIVVGNRDLLPEGYFANDTVTDVMAMLLEGLEPEPAAALDAATVAEVDALVEKIMAEGQIPGAAVGIVKDGQLVYAEGFGVTQLGGAEPVTADSVFVMASVAKSPVGMAVMQLVEAGKIDLDAPVTKYLPYFTMADPDVGAITIRQLLSHTSGMPDPMDWLAEYQDENTRTDEAALDDYVRSLNDDSLTFRPGEEWSYSNTGFDILGDVVAAVSGQTFEDTMQANILNPLGMKDSSYLLSDLDPAQLAAPQMYDENGHARTLDFYPYSRAHAPSGALYSNVNDMARFAIANLNQGELDGTQVLPASAYDEMWAPQAATTWAEAFGLQVANYGLGWFVGEFNGHPLIGNYGTEFGFQSHLGLFPDDDMAVIALVNLFDPEAGTFYAYDIGNGIAEVLLSVETEPTPQP